MPTLANKKHERFCQGIAAGKTGTDAYLDAGYKLSRPAAGRNAYALRKRPDVMKRIEEISRRLDEPGPKRRGAPSLYRAEMTEQAHNLGLLGYTDEQIAQQLGVSERTLENWKAKPEFLHALKSGKAPADAKVARSLFERSCGYSHPAVKILMGKDGEPVYAPYTEHYPPDTAAAFIWLKNRHPELWRDRKEHVVEERPFAALSKEERAQWAWDLVQRARRLLDAPTIEHEDDAD